jgi:hypothetical protein
MRPRSLLILIGLLPGLWLAAPAMAASSCDAPPGTAATDQYCETLPSADGMIDATGRHTPLAKVLPMALVRRMEHAGLLGEVLLALPAVAPADGGMRSAAVRKASTDPRLRALLPARPQNVRSSVGAVLGTNSGVGNGFAWTLVISLCVLAGISALGSIRVWSLR